MKNILVLILATTVIGLGACTLSSQIADAPSGKAICSLGSDLRCSGTESCTVDVDAVACTACSIVDGELDCETVSLKD